MRHHLMKLAAALRKGGMSLSDALKRAWQVIRLKANMEAGNASFFYTKEDGEERMAVGTFPAETTTTTAKKKPEDLRVIKYFDVLVNGWRSFRADRLLCI